MVWITTVWWRRRGDELWLVLSEGGKWVRLFWHFRHGVLVLLQALVSMEMKNSVCHACSWIEFQTLGWTEASGKPGSGGVGWMEPVATVMRNLSSLACVGKGRQPLPSPWPSLHPSPLWTRNTSKRVTDTLLPFSLAKDFPWTLPFC